MWQQPYEAVFVLIKTRVVATPSELHTQHQQVWEEIPPTPHPSPCRRMWAGSVCVVGVCVWANVREQMLLAACIERAGLPRSAQETREGSLDTAGCAEANYTVWLIEKVESGKHEPSTACFLDEEESCVLTLFFRSSQPIVFFQKCIMAAEARKYCIYPETHWSVTWIREKDNGEGRWICINTVDCNALTPFIWNFGSLPLAEIYIFIYNFV